MELRCVCGGGGLLLLLMDLWSSEIAIWGALAPGDNCDRGSVISTIMFPSRDASFFSPGSWSSSSGPRCWPLTQAQGSWAMTEPLCCQLCDSEFSSVHSWLCSCNMDQMPFFLLHSPKKKKKKSSALSQFGFSTFLETKSYQSTFNQRKGASRHRRDMIQCKELAYVAFGVGSSTRQATRKDKLDHWIVCWWRASCLGTLHLPMNAFSWWDPTTSQEPSDNEPYLKWLPSQC